jgi:hypothetical protein
MAACTPALAAAAKEGIERAPTDLISLTDGRVAAIARGIL